MCFLITYSFPAFNGDKYCAVVGGFRDTYVRQSLEDLLYPDEITSSKEHANLKKLTKMVTEHYNTYKTNYSGNIAFDADYGGRNFISYDH